MSKYRPATINPEDVIQRNYSNLKDAVYAANVPSGTQVFATSSKVGADTQDLSSLTNRVADVEVAVDKADKSAKAAQKAADGATMPVGACILLNAKDTPSLTGMWVYFGDVETKGGDTLYVYQRQS